MIDDTDTVKTATTAQADGAEVTETRPAGDGKPVAVRVRARATPDKTAKSPAKKQESKTVKKTKAKKPAKKSAAKKSGGGKRTSFDPAGKIVVLKSENPFREGSSKHDDHQSVLAANGKKVETFLTRGKRKALTRAVRRGLVKVAA